MNEVQKEKLRQCQIEMMDEVKRICDENNLKYYLSSGTLLGAIRHQGFIPWDDDVDLCMPREDYNKFVKMLPDKLGEKYFFVDWNNTPNYALAFGKIMMKGTVLREEKGNPNLPNAIYIDIFPLDYICDDEKIEKKCCKKMYFYKRLLLSKCHYNSANTFIKKIIYSGLYVISQFYSKQKLINLIENNIQLIGRKNKKYCYEITDSGVSRLSVDKKYLTDDFREDTEVVFENKLYNAPIGYKNVLTDLYGDYMTPPPESARENYHGIIEIDFGEDK